MAPLAATDRLPIQGRPRKRTRPRRTRPLRVETLERRRLLAADVRINEFLAANDSGLVDALGRHSDWIELHNAGDETADLAGWHLSDEEADKSKWVFPDAAEASIAPGEYRLVFASGDGVPDVTGALHANFSLDSGGEHLVLSRPDLSLVSEVSSGGEDYPRQRVDISYGFDSGLNERYFTTPTPGTANGTGIEGFVADTEFSIDRGYYESAIDVMITSETLGSTIVYTTDGSEPTLVNGTQVHSGASVAPSALVTISTTTALRAAAFKPDHLATDVDTQTYFFIDDVIRQPASPPGFPTTWGTAPAADYAMDSEVVDDVAYNTDLLTGLRDLPALSLTSNVDELFGPGGIYSNPNNSGLEIAVSAEYILPDGTDGFQIDAGLKIAGGASRNPNNSPKHSMSLRFRNEYGESKLNYPLFDESPVEEFNSLQLRALYNNSWIHWDNNQRSRGTLIRDQFIRDSLLAAGQDDAGRGSYAHVYLNGLYWGVYNVHERHDSSHYAEYQGGNSDDYDALNGTSVVDGTIDSFDALRAVVAAGDWTAIESSLDIDNFIDWSIAQAYGGNADLKVNGNWRAAGGGDGNGLWRFYSWDSERTLEGVTSKSPETITDATGMFNDLIAIPEFVSRFGDRVQKHFFDGGAFTPDAARQRWDARVDELETAIVAESARWGDYRRDVHPRGDTPSLYTRDDHWNPEHERLRSNYFPARSEWLIERYRQLGLFPTVGAPQFTVDGEPYSGDSVPPGGDLRLIADAQTIYYTTDGTDPRSAGGGVGASAISYDPATTETVVVASGDSWKYFDAGTDLGEAWRAADFDDTGWAAGPSELGYGDGDEATVVSFGGDPGSKPITTYFRRSVSVDDGGYAFAKVRIRRDDGVAAYWDGVEIGRNNLPAGATEFDTRAIVAAPDDGSDWLTFYVPAEQLSVGSHSLAVEIHQVHQSSSDVSFDAEVVLVTQSQAAIDLDDTLDVRVRSRDAFGNWSALRHNLFLVPHEPATAANLRISEIHYHPAGDGDAEFIELQNTTTGAGAVTLDLDELMLTDGPSSPLVIAPGTSLIPGAFALIVKDVTAFTEAYPAVSPELIIGEYSGSLSNSGERIRLVDAGGEEIADIEYDDGAPWPRWADGRGGSLVLRDPFNVSTDRLSKHYSWRSSVAPGGTPGRESDTPAGIWISEVLAHTDAPDLDAIELWNSTPLPIDIGGWFLSDDGQSPWKFSIPAGTIVPAGGHVVFDESDFNADPLAPESFALDGSGGDSVWLFTGSGGVVTSLIDEVKFDATFNGFSLGRIPGAEGRLVPLAHTSLGAVNGMFAISDVVISEVHYHPAPPSPAAILLDPTVTSSDLEFVELLNRTETEVPLQNWRLRGERDFDFTGAHSLPAGSTAVLVGFDPSLPADDSREAAFRAHHGIDGEVVLLGPASGSLSNREGLVRLLAPDTPPTDDPELIPRVLVDEVLYDDAAPWPTAADGAGSSLQRIAPSTLGNHADSWLADTPTPGNVPAAPQVIGIEVNGGAPNRSSVTSLSIEFDQAVIAESDAIEIINLTTGHTVTGLSISPESLGGQHFLHVTFTTGDSVHAGGGLAMPSSLADGDYQITVRSGRVTGQTDHFALDGNHVDSFYRKYGDQNGNGTVELFDFVAFRSTYLHGEGSPEFLAELDYDRNGIVNLFDFVAFRGNYGA